MKARRRDEHERAFIEFVADDTLEGLASQLGLSGDAAANFVASVERYNTMCQQGFDEDFGRECGKSVAEFLG